MATGDELIEALFGAARARGPVETALGLGAAAIAIGFVWRARFALAIRVVSADLALTSGIDVRRLDLRYLLAFALTVAMGLRYLGVLLMGSLVIIPASTARYLARSMAGVQAIAVVLAVAAMLAGELLAPRLHAAPGPVAIVAAAVMFFVALLVRPSPAGASAPRLQDLP